MIAFTGLVVSSVLLAVQSRPHKYSPDITVIVAFALLVGAAVLFLGLLQRVLDRLRPRSLYGAVARQGMRAARAVYPRLLSDVDPNTSLDEAWCSEHARELGLPRGAGVVTSFDAVVLTDGGTPGWSDLLDLAFDEIREYGASSVQVPRRLRAALEDLRADSPDERHAAIDRHLAWLEESVRRAHPAGSAEQAIAARADRIGLGLARSS